MRRSLRHLPRTVAVVLLVAWLLGRLVSDRFAVSQWLAWIPTVIAFAAAIVGLALSLRPRHPRWQRVTWGTAAALLAGNFLFLEHRFLRVAADPPAEAVKLVHWNLSDGPTNNADVYAERIIALDGDITILTNAGTAPWEPPALAWLGLTGREGVQRRPYLRRPFTIMTRLPIRELRSLVRNDEISITLLEVDTEKLIGRTLAMYLIDLPSDPRRGRATIARETRAMLEASDAPPPDVVVGDFNMTRGGASLRSLFPGLRNAYDEAGHGYGASYHRMLLFYHIDHVLLGDNVRCERYDLIDAGLARHRAQVAYIVP